MQKFHVSKSTYAFPLDKPFPFAILGQTVKALVSERDKNGSQTNKRQQRDKK
jgi:hypothetical protein